MLLEYEKKKSLDCWGLERAGRARVSLEDKKKTRITTVQLNQKDGPNAGLDERKRKKTTRG